MFLFALWSLRFFVNECRFVVFMFFIWDFGVTFIFELFANVGIEKGYFLSLNVLSFDDFVETGIFSLTTGTETFLFHFGLDAGVLVGSDDLLMFVLFLFELWEFFKEHFVFQFEIFDGDFGIFQQLKFFFLTLFQLCLDAFRIES